MSYIPSLSLQVSSKENTFKNNQDGTTFALAMDEYNDIAYRFNSFGINFFKTSGELNSAEENKNNYKFTQQAISFGQLNQSRKIAVFVLKMVQLVF